MFDGDYTLSGVVSSCRNTSSSCTGVYIRVNVCVVVTTYHFNNVICIAESPISVTFTLLGESVCTSVGLTPAVSSVVRAYKTSNFVTPASLFDLGDRVS